MNNEKQNSISEAVQYLLDLKKAKIMTIGEKNYLLCGIDYETGVGDCYDCKTGEKIFFEVLE